MATVVPEFDTVKEGISPDPDAPNPILGFELAQE